MRFLFVSFTIPYGFAIAVSLEAVCVFAFSGQENVVSPETVVVFCIPMHKKGRSTRYCRNFHNKKAVPCDTVAIFSQTEQFRARLSPFSAYKRRSVRYCHTFQPQRAVPCDTVTNFIPKTPFRTILSQFSTQGAMETTSSQSPRAPGT
jgi:hypothetical protein